MSSGNREIEILDALVALTGKLVKGHDVVDLLSDLTRNCVDLLDVAASGLLLDDGSGRLHVMAASSEATRELELLQVQRDDGPCLQCFHDGAAVREPDLAGARERWPLFVGAALAAGFVSVHAVPMRWQDRVLGALGLFGTTSGALGRDDMALAQALADVATVSLVRDQQEVDHHRVNQQLHAALSSRVVVEQAKGIVAQVGDLDMTEAFAALRRYARDRGERLSQVCAALATRQMSARAVLEHRAHRP